MLRSGHGADKPGAEVMVCHKDAAVPRVFFSCILIFLALALRIFNARFRIALFRTDRGIGRGRQLAEHMYIADDKPNGYI